MEEFGCSLPEAPLSDKPHYHNRVSHVAVIATLTVAPAQGADRFRATSTSMPELHSSSTPPTTYATNFTRLDTLTTSMTVRY